MMDEFGKMFEDFGKIFEDFGAMMSKKPKPNAQVELRVVMDRALYEEIRTAVLVRALAHGGINGLADSFLGRFVEKIDAGETVWNVQKKT